MTVTLGIHKTDFKIKKTYVVWTNLPSSRIEGIVFFDELRIILNLITNITALNSSNKTEGRQMTEFPATVSSKGQQDLY